MRLHTNRTSLFLTLAGALLLASCGGSSTDETPSGQLTVLVQTGGSQLDPDGYTLSLSELGDSTVTINDTLRAEVPPGTYLAMNGGDLPLATVPLTLSGVASNCEVAVTGVPAIVTDGGADTLGFTVTCTDTTGTLAVKLETGGVAVDPDGYHVAINGGSSVAVGVNGVTTSVPVPVGGNSVALTGVVMNCTPEVGGPYPVTITPGAADTLTIDLTCEWPRVVARGPGGIVVVNPDGTNEQVLYPNTAGLVQPDAPAWSLDRTKIAFDRLPPAGMDPGRRVGIGDLDSVPTLTLLMDDPFSQSPRWRPNGPSLLFLGHDTLGSPLRVFTRTLTPGSAIKVSPDSLWAYQADWSPDGTKIAFAARDTALMYRLYVMNADGSSVIRVSPDSLTHVTMVRWSPAGDRLILLDQNDFWTLGPTGSAPAKIQIPDHTALASMTWSPDGSSLMVLTFNTISGGSDLFHITPTGTVLGTMNRSAGQWDEFDWR